MSFACEIKLSIGLRDLSVRKYESNKIINVVIPILISKTDSNLSIDSYNFSKDCPTIRYPITDELLYNLLPTILNFADWIVLSLLTKELLNFAVVV